MKIRFISKKGWRVWFGALMVALLPAAALAQWTHTGDASIQGKLGVGTQDPARGFHLQSHSGIFRIDRDADPTSFMLTRTAPGDFETIWKTFLFGVKASGVDAGEFTIRDMGAQVSGVVSSRRLTIANDGRFAFGDIGTPEAGLHLRNPVAGDIFRLDNLAGTQVVSVADSGDLSALGEDLELRLASTSSGGFDLVDTSTLLGNTSGGTVEEAFLALNEDTAVICSPGDRGLLNIVDQDGYLILYRFNNNILALGQDTDFTINATNQQAGDDLILSTTGEQLKFVGDSDNNTAQDIMSTWYNNGTANADRVMDLNTAGNLRIGGTLTQNHAFDLAEAYWKSEGGIEAGDVVRIDPEEPNAVVLARADHDPAVVGVVSTDPGIVLGGSAFSAEKLTELWGEEVGARFAKQRKAIEKSLAKNDPYIQGRTAKVGQLKSALAKGGKKADVARSKVEAAQEEQQLAEAIEDAAIQAFCEENLAEIALSGRVPVKVDASYGAIQVGDLLVASATPGHAMRADNPAPQGTVIGKALEAYASGQGTIMMMVLNR